MIRMVNGVTGSTMWVHESRIAEYERAGHKLALPPKKEEPKEPVKRPKKKKAE